MPHLVMEREFDPPLTDADLVRMKDQLTPCLEVEGVRWDRSYPASDLSRMVCIFEAADAESVRMAFRTARVRPGKIWSTDIVIGTPASA